jgi:DNA primase
MYLGNITPGNCFIFEGVFDALAFYELTGIQNIIALGGAAEFNQQKIKQYLQQMTNQNDINMISCLDDDDAGKKAMQTESSREEVRYYSPKMACRKFQVSGEDFKDWNELLIKVKTMQHVTA